MSADSDVSLTHYVSVQNKLIADTNEAILYSDDAENVYHFRGMIDSLSHQVQLLRHIKINVVNYTDIAERDQIIKCLDSDERSVLDIRDLLEKRIQLHVTRPTLATPNSMMVTYDVMDTLNNWADAVGVIELRNMPYVPEMEHLLTIDTYKVRPPSATTIDRIVCAAIIFQALLRKNSRIVDFSRITSSDQPIMLEKLKCILMYVLQILEMLKNKSSELEIPITIRHHVIDPNTIRIGENSTPINVNNVDVDVYAPYHRYDSESKIKPYQFTVVYVQDKIGSRAYDLDAAYEDVWFMKCPELYAIPCFARNLLGDNESYALINIKQSNVLTTYAYNTKRVFDNDAYKDLAYNNFLMYRSCDYKTGTDINQADLAHLNREIGKMMSGVRYEQTLSTVQLEFRTSPHNCNDNRTFQFLIELLVCMAENARLYYCASNAEQEQELNDTLETIQNFSVSQLYNKLTNYNFNTTGAMNFYKQQLE
jgi:Poly (ADP-ribose) glycohydrolase (PARG)